MVIHSDILIEGNKQLIKVAKLTGSNDEFKVKLEKIKKELKETQELLEKERAKEISDPTIQMKRIVSQNLARSSLDTRRLSLIAKDMGHMTQSISLDNIPQKATIEEEKAEDDNLQSQISEAIEKSQVSDDLFMSYSGYNTLESLNILEREEDSTQIEIKYTEISIQTDHPHLTFFLEDLVDMKKVRRKADLEFMQFAVGYTRQQKKLELTLEKIQTLSICNDIEEAKSVNSEGSAVHAFNNTAKDNFELTTDPLKSFFILVLVSLHYIDNTSCIIEQFEYKGSSFGNVYVK